MRNVACGSRSLQRPAEDQPTAEPLLKDQLLEDLDRLSEHLQRRVLEFAHTLAVAPHLDPPGAALLPFFGILDEQSADEMEDAI